MNSWNRSSWPWARRSFGWISPTWSYAHGGPTRAATLRGRRPYAGGGPTRAAALRGRRYSRNSGRWWLAVVARGGADEAAAALVAADSIRSAPIKFLYRGFAHSVAAPLRKKPRSACLLGCKRPRNGSRSLPPFSGRWTGRGRVGRKAGLCVAFLALAENVAEGGRSRAPPVADAARRKPSEQGS